MCDPHLPWQKAKPPICPENESLSTKFGDSLNPLVSRHFCHSLSFLACHEHLEGTVEAPIVGKCWRGDCVRPAKWQLQLTATDGTPRLQSDPPTCCCHAPCHYCRQRNNITLSREGLHRGPEKRGQTLPTTITALYTDERVELYLELRHVCNLFLHRHALARIHRECAGGRFHKKLKGTLITKIYDRHLCRTA